MDASAPRSRSFRLLWLFLSFCGLGLLVFLSFRGLLSAEAVGDDFRQLEHVEEFMAAGEFPLLDSMSLFRPFKNAVFYFGLVNDGSIARMRTIALLIYVAAAFAVYVFLRAFDFNHWWSLAGAALWGVHPTGVSSVGLISATNNVVCVAFLALFAAFSRLYFKTAETAAGPAGGKLLPWYYGGALACLALCLVSYEVAIMAGPIAVMAEWIRNRKAFFGRRWWGFFGPAAAISIAYLVLRQALNASSQVSVHMLPPSADHFDLMLSAARYTLRHLWLWVFPFGQSGFLITDIPSEYVVESIVSWVVLGLTIGICFIGLMRKGDLVITGIFFFLLAIFPLSNYVPLRNGPICNYYLLIPSVGLVLASLAALKLWWLRWTKAGGNRLLPGSIMPAGLALVLLLFVVEDQQRIAGWQSNTALNEMTLRSYPDNYVAKSNIANILMDEGKYLQAEEMIGQVMAEAPFFIHAYQAATELYLKVGTPEAALPLLDFYEERYGRDSRIVFCRALVKLRLKDYAAAEALLAEAGRMGVPDQFASAVNEAVLKLLESTGQFERAEAFKSRMGISE